MTKNNEMVKIWFDDMEEMFQIKLSEWEKLKDNALPPYNNYSEHHYASGSNDFDWFENSDLEYMYHRIKVWREGMKKILIVGAAILTLSSCGMMNKLSDEQLHQRSKIDYEMNKLYNEYQVKNDSLLIEYYKIK